MSYAATTAVTNTITSDAQFRAWGLIYAAKMTSFGWVQTADTGQVNWATVTSPGVANTVGGYEIWRMADALQATSPIFLKLEYGAGAVAANGSIWVTLGNATNGAGALTGVTSVRQQVQCTATAGVVTHYWSGDTNRLNITVTGAAAGTSMYVGIERTVDTAGAVTAEGALLLYRGTSTQGQHAWNQAIGPTTATWETTYGSMGPSLAPFGTTGASVAVYPIFHTKGVFFPHGLNAFCYEHATIGVGSTITFSVYSSNHTFICLGSPNFISLARGGFSTVSMMVRYE